jgi:hypothetical protein
VAAGEEVVSEPKNKKDAAESKAKAKPKTAEPKASDKG